MTTHIDIDGAAREVRRLRGGLSRLISGAQHDIEQREAEWANGARRAGSRAWTIAERDAGQVLERIENNPLAVASAALAMGALVGLYFLFQGSLGRTRRVAHAPVRRASRAASEGLNGAHKKGTKARRTARKPARKT